MDKMLSYIFGNLKSSESTMRNIKITLKRQAKFNQTVKTLTLAVAIYAIVTAIRDDEQNKKIEELRDEIKELKSAKGE